MMATTWLVRLLGSAWKTGLGAEKRLFVKVRDQNMLPDNGSDIPVLNLCKISSETHLHQVVLKLFLSY